MGASVSMLQRCILREILGLTTVYTDVGGYQHVNLFENCLLRLMLGCTAVMAVYRPRAQFSSLSLSGSLLYRYIDIYTTVDAFALCIEYFALAIVGLRYT